MRSVADNGKCQTSGDRGTVGYSYVGNGTNSEHWIVINASPILIKIWGYPWKQFCIPS